MAIFTYGRNYDYLDIFVVDKLFKPDGRVVGDGVKQGVVEEIVNITVTGNIKKTFERFL